MVDERESFERIGATKMRNGFLFWLEGAIPRRFPGARLDEIDDREESNTMIEARLAEWEREIE